MIATRDLAGQSVELEKELAHAQALARVLTFALRNESPEPINRCSLNLAIALDAAISQLVAIRGELQESGQ